MARVYPCSFSYKLVYETKFDAPIRGHRVYKELWKPQKDDILYCKKDSRSEALDTDKHTVGIYKEDRLAWHRFMREDPMNCVSRRNLSWRRRNMMKLRNLILRRAMSESAISCVVMVFRYVVKWLIDKFILYILYFICS